MLILLCARVVENRHNGAVLSAVRARLLHAIGALSRGVGAPARHVAIEGRPKSLKVVCSARIVPDR